MGVSCSRRLPNPPGWEKLQADYEDTSPSDYLRHGGQFALFIAQDDNADCSVAEARLKHALRTGDARLIERACNEAEANGLEKSKLALARAEVRWLKAKTSLDEAIRSGDAKRIEQASIEAEREGIDVAEVLSKSSRATKPSGSNDAPVCSMQGFGECLSSKATMSAAVAVLLYEWSAYNVVYLGKILPAVDKELAIIPFAIIFNVLWGLATWSFLRCHCSDPGSVPQRWYDFVDRMGDALPVAPARLEWQPGKATFCKRCDAPRPERTHHCHVCGICILRMDHHCPWINNCVGFNNHKFFLLLVAYCFLSSIVALTTSLPELIHCVLVLREIVSGDMDWEAEQVRACDMVVFLIFGVLALLFAALLTPMVLTHFELGAYNVTTIEGHYEGANMTNPFDMGSPAENFSELFGEYGLDWFLPIHPLRPLTDGICFVRCLEDRGDAEESGTDFGDSVEEQIWRLRYQVRAIVHTDTSLRSSERSTQRSGLQWLFGGSSRESSRTSAEDKPMLPKPGKRVLRDAYGRRIVSI